MRTSLSVGGVSLRAAVAAVAIVAGFAGVAPVRAAEDNAKKADAPTRSPVVVELFTSEGCSSCPPADDYFADIVASESAKDGSVLPITWHVDYWDHLVWRDPYASPKSTQRQRDYASVMKEAGEKKAGVYTPQLVVDGTAALVGSDRVAGDAAIKQAREKRPARNAQVGISISKREAGAPVHIDASVTDAPADADVVAVVVEDDLVSMVKRGENEGRTLKHARVVRASEASVGGKSFDLRLPMGVDESKASVVVFVQEKRMGQIIGAASTPLIAKPVEATLQSKLDEKWSQVSASAPADKIAAYEASIKKIADTGVLQTAKKAGDKAPGFDLPNAKGGTVALADLLKKGPAVVVWYRGGWCPFCNIQLHEYQVRLNEFEALGATMVAISPEPPDASLTTAERNQLRFGVLSDVGGAIARQYGVMYKVPGGDGRELPLAATYVVNTDGTIAYAFIESDYRQRAEPQAIVDALTKLRNETKAAH